MKGIIWLALFVIFATPTFVAAIEPERPQLPPRESGFFETPTMLAGLRALCEEDGGDWVDLLRKCLQKPEPAHFRIIEPYVREDDVANRGWPAVESDSSVKR